MKKFFDNWNRKQSSSSSSTSQKEPLQRPEGQCWRASSLCSLRQLKSYKAFGKIYKAACEGDIAAVQGSLLLGKTGVNDRDKNDRTLLHYACAYGHPDIVNLLIEWNCDINLRDSDNSTALIKASQFEQGKCASILLEHGADPNAKDKNGNTALHFAVWHNNISMTANLLVYDADLNIRNEDSFTPVIVSLLKNNESLSKFLIDKKAQIPPEADELGRDSNGSDSSSSSYSSKDEDTAPEFGPKLRTDAPSGEKEKQDRLDRPKHENLKSKVKRKHQTEESKQPQTVFDGTCWEIFKPLILDIMKNNNQNLERLLAEERAQIPPEADGLGGNSSSSSSSSSSNSSKDKDTAPEFGPKLRTDDASREKEMQDRIERLERDFLKLKLKRKRQTKLKQPQVTLDGTSWVHKLSRKLRRDNARREEEIQDWLDRLKRDFLKLKEQIERQTEELEQPQVTLGGPSWAQEFCRRLRTDASSKEKELHDRLDRLERDFLKLKLKRTCQTEESVQPQVTFDCTSWAQEFCRRLRTDALREEEMQDWLDRLERDFLKQKEQIERQTEELEQPQVTLGGPSWAQEFSPKLQTDDARREEEMQDELKLQTDAPNSEEEKQDRLERLKRDFLKLKEQIERQTEGSEQPQVTLDGTSWVTEKVDKHQVNRLQATENLNHSREQASEDQKQSAVHASENRNHSVIHVSENLNQNVVHASDNRDHREVPAAENVVSTAVKVAESQSHNAEVRFLQKQDGKTKERLVPAEESGEHAESIKNTSNIKDKVNKEVNPIVDSSEAMPPKQRKSADCEILNFDTILDLVDQLRRKSKDPDILLIIWYAIHSYKRSMELQNYKFELISEKNKKIKDQVNLLKRDLAETKETKLELEVLKAKLRGEVSNMRLAQENSNLRNRVRQNSGKDEEFLKNSSEKDEKQLKKYIKLNQSLKYTLEEEWKKSEEYEKELTRVKNIFKMRQKNSNEQEKRKCSCSEDLNTNQSETDEINILRHKIDLATERLNQVLCSCEQLKSKNQRLRQKVVAMTAIQEKCKVLEDREERLNQEFLFLEAHMQKNMIEHREAEMLKQEIEKKSKLQLKEILDGISMFAQTQSLAHEQAEQKKENSFALKTSELRCRIKSMESKLCRAQVHEDSIKFKLEVYQQCYQDQLKVTASLSEKIINASKSQVEAQKDSSRLTAEEELLIHPHTSAVHIPEDTGVSGLHHSLEFNGKFTPSLGTSSHQQRVGTCRPRLPRFL